MAWNGSSKRNANSNSVGKRPIDAIRKSSSIMRGAIATLVAVVFAIGCWLWFSQHNESEHAEPPNQIQKPKETNNPVRLNPKTTKEVAPSKDLVSTKPKPQRFGKYEIEVDENG